MACDGRDEFRQQVASGHYFYQLKAVESVYEEDDFVEIGFIFKMPES